MKSTWEFTKALAVVSFAFAVFLLSVQVLSFVTTVPPLKEFPNGGPYAVFDGIKGNNLSIMYWEDIAHVVRYQRYSDGRETAREETFWDVPLRQLESSDSLFQKIQKIARRERPKLFQGESR